MARIRSALLGLVPLLLASCASPWFDVGKTETVLQLNRAWFDGHRVEYVTTDISDVTLARQSGANYVPRLVDALPATGHTSLVERVYKFPKGEQIGIFQSAPVPAGATNTDKNYSPLWRLVMVTWLKPNSIRELKSEEEVLAAQDKGEVSLKVTNIVANCPITRSADGSRLQGSR